MSNKKILSFYKKLLRTAEYFPSKNKQELINGIKEEFRLNKNLKDQKKIKDQLEQANSVLERFQHYINTFKEPDDIKPHHRNIVMTKQKNDSSQWNFTF